MRAHSLLLPPSPIGPSPRSPSSMPTFLARSRNNHTKSPFFSLTFPPAISFASKNTKGKTNSVLRTASFVAKYCLRSASFSRASLASADFVCAFACTATELEGLKRFFTIVAGSEEVSSSSSWVDVADDTPPARALGFTLCSCADASSSSSSPNDSPIFFTPFLRFLKPAGLGVCSLCLVRQSPFMVSFTTIGIGTAPSITRSRAKDIPALISRWRARAAATALLEGFGASLAEIGVVHQADGLLFEQVFRGVRGGGEA